MPHRRRDTVLKRTTTFNLSLKEVAMLRLAALSIAALIRVSGFVGDRNSRAEAAETDPGLR